MKTAESEAASVPAPEQTPSPPGPSSGVTIPWKLTSPKSFLRTAAGAMPGAEASPSTHRQSPCPPLPRVGRSGGAAAARSAGPIVRSATSAPVSLPSLTSLPRIVLFLIAFVLTEPLARSFAVILSTA